MNSPYSITRRFQFCCGHRVFRHESKCNHVHGHNYVMFVAVESGELDSIGRVIDFSEVKTLLGGWIDRFIDHNFVVFCEDPLALAVAPFCKSGAPYIMASNPTAENMAMHFAEVFQSILDAHQEARGGFPLYVSKIELWETENCKAEWTR